MNHLANAGVLIVQTLFGLILGLFFFRLLMQGFRVDFRNPLSQFVYRSSNPVVIPLQKILPVVGGWNLAVLALCLLLAVIEAAIVYRLQGVALGLLPVLIVGLALFIEFAVFSLLVSIIVRAIISFVSADRYNPFVQVLFQITEPLLRPIRRMIPPLGGLDLSPLFVILALQLVRVLVVNPLLEVAFSLVIG